MRAILHCRTSALGGHIDVCPRCGGDKTISYNSCRNRHCPKCQTQSRQRWIAARKEELLETRYFHVVFTLPHELHSLVLQNEAELYSLLFRAVADTLLEVAANPEHLGAEIGFFGILHTWGQNLLFHPHIHCVIPGGGLSANHSQWIHPRYPFFLPIRVLSKVFRGKFVDGLRRIHRKNRLIFAGSIERMSEPKCFAPSYERCSDRIGLCMQSPPSAARTSSSLSRTLHASCRDLELPIGLLRWQSDHVPMEGLRSR